MKIFTVAFPDEFDPIAEQIEQLSNEFDQSKSCTNVTFSVSSSILPPSESHGDMKNDLKKYVKNYGRV